MNTQANLPPIEKTIEMAEKAFQSGDAIIAERLFQQVLSIDPYQPRALNFFAMNAAAKGDVISASALFEKAIGSTQKVAIVFANYAKLLRMQNQNERALQMLDEALKIDPNVFALHFEKASIYEVVGQQKNAALAYQSGLLLMPESVKSIPALKEKIGHAYAITQENQRHLSVFLESRLGNTERFNGDRRYERFSECLDVVLGKKKAFIQKPQMINFPQLPAIPFYNRNDFAWAPQFEASFENILSELNEVVALDDAGFIPYVYSEPGKDPGVFGPLCDNLEWGAYFLVNQGNVIPDHCKRCPDTLEALGHAPQVVIKKRGPTSFFSSLKPNTHIPPHHGATNTRLTVHMPLVIPSNCALRVGNQVSTWKPGELMIFDDTIEHEAWNGSDQRRIVLIFDVWNPLLTALERELVATTVEGIVDYYGAEAPLGEL